MQKLRTLPAIALLVALLGIALISTAQAYSVMPNVWRQNYTSYAIDATIQSEFGAAGVARVQEAASYWSSQTIFNFNRNDNEGNWVRAFDLPYPNNGALAIMVPYRDNKGLYRNGFEIRVNTSPDVFPPVSWYTGTNSNPPSGTTDLRTVLNHEFGHAAGLNHILTGEGAVAEDQLMYPFIPAEAVKFILPDDRNGIRYLYEAGYNATHPDNTDEWLRAWTGAWDNLGLHPAKVGYKGPNWDAGTGFPRAHSTTAAWSNGGGQPGATSWIAFTGSRITWRFTKAFNRSESDIYINGNFIETINAYDGNDILWQVQKTWDLPNGNHLLEIRGDGDDFTDLDAFVVNIDRHTGTIDDSSSAIRFIGSGSSWTRASGWSGPTNGTVSWSNTPEDAAVFTFSGTGITYRFTKAPNRGKAKVTIDGVQTYIIDLYSPTVNWQSSQFFGGLSAGTHTIHIAVTGDKHPSSSDVYVDVDQFVVQ